MKILEQIPSFLSTHKRAALCIVTYTEGSTPRKAGSKMLVSPEGVIAGTIGGGAIEKQVIDEAIDVIKQEKAIRKHYELEEDLGMQCGGVVEVYIEPLGRLPQLYIFGAGHVGKALASFAAKLNFNVTLLDFRPISFSEEELNTCRFIHGDYFQTLETLGYDENTFIVIVSPSHSHDFELLKKLGKRTFAYLGMIGSTRKVARAKEVLIKEEGIFTDNEFERFDTPMGLPMAAETPEEISISILGKLIDVRNQKLRT